MRGFALVACGLLLGGTTAPAQAPTPPAPAPAAASAAPPAPAAPAQAIPGVIAAGERLAFVRGGFNGTEGLIGLPDGSLLFCEQNADRVLHLGPGDSIAPYVENANRPIGLAFDPGGRLVAAESRDPMIGVLMPARETLAESFAGQRLVRPNDLVIDRKGGIYFTDPLPTAAGAFRPTPAGRKPLIFYRRPDGTLTQVTDAIAEPNGIQLSPDGRTLYATAGDHVAAFAVDADGSAMNRRRFAEVAGGDGMAIDDAGRLYVGVEGGIAVVAPDGRLLGRIPAPVRVQSVAFAGKDRRTLYAAGAGNLFRVGLLATGIRSRAK